MWTRLSSAAAWLDSWLSISCEPAATAAAGPDVAEVEEEEGLMMPLLTPVTPVSGVLGADVDRLELLSKCDVEDGTDGLLVLEGFRRRNELEDDCWEDPT